MLLQLLHQLVVNNTLQIAYFTGEETQQQVAERNQRLFQDKEAQQTLGFDLYHTTKLEDIVTTAQETSCEMLVIDSIQTIYSTVIDSPAGSVAQVKYCSEKLSEFCKGNNITAVII